MHTPGRKRACKRAIRSPSLPSPAHSRDFSTVAGQQASSASDAGPCLWDLDSCSEPMPNMLQILEATKTRRQSYHVVHLHHAEWTLASNLLAMCYLQHRRLASQSRIVECSFTLQQLWQRVPGMSCLCKAAMLITNATMFRDSRESHAFCQLDWLLGSGTLRKRPRRSHGQVRGALTVHLEAQHCHDTCMQTPVTEQTTDRACKQLWLHVLLFWSLSFLCTATDAL